MSKVYIAAKIPESATRLLDDAGISYTMYDKMDTPSELEIIEGVKEANALVSAVNVPVSEKVMLSNPDLKVIANVGEGFNNIDKKAADRLNLPVTNTPTYNSIASTAELAFTLMLTVSRHILNGHRMAESHNFPGWQVMGYLGGDQVSGKTLAIIGFGKIGRKIASYAKAFDMKILYVDPNRAPEEVETEYNATQVSKEEALKTADYVILMTNLTPENYHLISKDELALMKESAYLINTGRGPLLDEEALADALDAKQIRGAALDVHEHEPKMNMRLTEMSNVVLTPHTGNDTHEARDDMAKIAVSQVIKALTGEKLDHQV